MVRVSVHEGVGVRALARENRALGPLTLSPPRVEYKM